MDKVDVVVEIENYHLEMNDFFRRQKMIFIWVLLFAPVGIPMFIKLMKRRKELEAQRETIQEMLQEISNKIPLEEYLNLRKRFTSTKTY